MEALVERGLGDKHRKRRLAGARRASQHHGALLRDPLLPLARPLDELVILLAQSPADVHDEKQPFEGFP